MRTSKLRFAWQLTSSMIAWAVVASNGSALELRNFRQLEAHFSAATGISSSNYNVRIIAAEASAGLPEQSDINLFSGTFVRSASHLAAAYCVEFVVSETKLAGGQRRAHQSVNFTLNPKEQTEQMLSDTIKKFALYFWDREIVESERLLLIQAAEAVRANLPENTQATIDLYSALCAMAATSLESVLIRD